ncbi:cytochrome P450 [Glomus cerebriforme]|uniref:Cytochrome P450 n=1 Tax=Glomus cerebriforme TaxID=658196 RepID=A0A397SZB7_9GLOM|nr:cytochrome P450 [Glomus cerebriforme]
MPFLTTFFESLKITDVFIVLSTIIFFYIVHFYYNYFTRVNPLPGPIPLPIFGNALNKSGDVGQWFQKLHKKYGDIFEITILGTRRIFLCRGEYIEKMLDPSTNTIYFQRFPYIKDLDDLKVFGTGILANLNYNSWRYNRTFFSQAILTPSFTNETLNKGHQLFYEMENYWKEIGPDTPIDYSAWMHRFTNDMIVVLTTGERIYSLPSYFNTISEKKTDIPSAPFEDSEEFIKSIRMFMLGNAFIILTPAIIRHYLPYFRQRQDEVFKNRDYLFNKLDQIIKTRRKEIEETPLDVPLSHDMLTSFITANTPRDINKTRKAEKEFLRPMTDEEIRGNMRDAIVAGTETTANTLSFIAYYLGHNPEIKEKLLQELYRVFGDDMTRPVTHEDLDKLEYTEAVIYEISRLSPAVIMMVRNSSGPGEVAGYNWPAGTTFHIYLEAINKNKAHWEDPEKADPERFLKKDEKRHKNAFNMWGGGMRICPGRKLAMIELKLLIALVYRKYDVELVDMNAPLKTRSTIINYCQELMVKIKPRNLSK